MTEHTPPSIPTPPPKPSLAAVKNAQRKHVLTVLVIIFFIGWAVLALFSRPEVKPESTAGDNDSHFVSPLKRVNETSVWVEKLQNGLAKEQKTTQTLTQQLQVLHQAKAQDEKIREQHAQQLEKLAAQLNQLENTLKKTADASQTAGNALPNTANARLASHGIREDYLQLTPLLSRSNQPATDKNPDTYVPSGTFVRAVMIGGADTSAGVNSQSNPTPVLFRIIDQGTLPNQYRSRLKGCFVTAAAIGDISSERGQMRLENLSCVGSQGEVVDMQVEGTVFGPEGKNGVRGTPLWREGALLKRAFAAGALSGLSDGLAQQYTSSQFTANGTSTMVNSSDVFRYGAAQGVSRAMDKLADYHIRRADQYHPVIQISAGTVVDIVFLKGFYLDGQKHDSAQASALPPLGTTASSAVNLDANASPPPPTTLPLTPQQIEALKSQTGQTAQSS